MKLDLKLSDKRVKVIGVVFILLVLLCIFGVGCMKWFGFRCGSRFESFENSKKDIQEKDELMVPYERDDTVFVKLYATWCPHCKTMEDDWKKLVEKYHGRIINGSKLSVLSIEEKNMSIFTDAFGSVEGYPTLVVLRKGSEPKMYEGERTFEALDEFVQVL